MEPQRIERKLAGILSADVAGYSRLMSADEIGTLRTLTAYRKVTDSLIQQHYGRIVNTAGDSVLAEFASAVDAIQCAVAIQQALKVQNADLSPERKMEFRIGLNVGDVVVEGEQIYGDGVNVAARLQGLADAGGILISGTVYDQIENKLPLAYKYLGEQAVKNIAKPVRVYRVGTEVPSPLVGEACPEPSRRSQGEGASGRTRPVTTPYPNLPPQGGKEPKPHRVGIAHRNWAVAAVAGLVLVAVALVAVRYLPRPPLSTQDSALITQEAPALPLPDKPSIAVLPFVNLSEDPKQEYFSDGLTEDLITDLSKFSGLFVIARNSVFTYKGKAVKVAEVGRELGVRYVLEGSVRKAEDQVRITAQLVEATTGHHLWSERYDRELKGIFALQDEIIQQIVGNLNVEVWQAELERIRRIPTNNLTAYDHFLRGVELYQRYTKETTDHARQMFEKVLELDPTYAAAYQALGWTYHSEWIWQWSQDPQTLEQYFTLAQKALALDDSLPYAHMLLSQAYLWKRQHEQAIVEAERAIALNLNDAWGYLILAGALNFSGKPEEALGAAEKAMRLDPRNRELYLFDVGSAYRLMGRYEEAITTLKRAITRYPNILGGHLTLAAVYSELGKDAEARAEVAEVLRLNPKFSLEVHRQRAPIKDPAAFERHLAALRKAGLK